MAKITAAKRNAEPNKEFGLPEERKYPMPDAAHAKNAKALNEEVSEVTLVTPPLFQ